jgi:isoquinoline 1-oxidoreductase beta subunit
MIAKCLQTLAKTPPSRRGFLAGAVAMGGALVIGTTVNFRSGPARAASPAVPDAPPNPNAFIRIAPDNTVTVMIKHLDMGQGNTTGLATIVADELDADWAQMRTAFAPADSKLYNNLMFGPVQGTGGSTAISNSWMQLRKAGAAAREMLVAAAVFEWKVPASEITLEKGFIRHLKSNRSASFGEFATSASTLPCPRSRGSRSPRTGSYIGKRVPRIDSVEKTNGAGRLCAGRAPPRSADRRRGACAGVRRQAAQLRRGPRQGRRRCGRCRGDPDRGRGAGARHLVGPEGARGPAAGVG